MPTALVSYLHQRDIFEFNYNEVLCVHINEVLCVGINEVLSVGIAWSKEISNSVWGLN